MQDAIHYVPILTTLGTIAFAPMVYARYRAKIAAGSDPGANRHLLWWAFGIAMYGVGTLTESLNTLFGWHEPIFRAWYISGALLGGAPLAQGSIYLLMGKKWGDRTAVAAFSYIAIAACFVLAAPVDRSAVTDILSGKVFEWTWVRLFSPFINTYAFIFLVGGAAYSAWVFWRAGGSDHRVLGNIAIAVGALLPGIGGSFSRAGHTEVLYATEFVGLILIYIGFRLGTRDRSPAAAPVAPAEARA